MLVTKLRHVLQLSNQAFGKYKFQIAFLALLSFVGSLLEGIGINSIIPLFSFVNRSDNKGTDTISQIIEKFFNLFHLQYTLKSLLLFIIALFIVKAIIIFLATYIGARVYITYEQRMRSELLSATINADWPYLLKQKSGHLEQVIVNDVLSSSTLLSYLSTVILIVANLLVYGIVAINISPLIALLTVILGIFIFFFFKPFFQKNKTVSGRVEKVYKHVAHFINESMFGVKAIKAMAAEGNIQAQGDEFFEHAKKLNITIVSVKNLTNALLQPVGLIFIIGIFSFFYKLTAFNFASFAVIVYAINKIFSYIQLAQSQLHGIMILVPYVERIEAYRAEALAHQEVDAGAKPFSFKQSLEFKKVSYQHTEDKPTLNEVTFKVAKGEMIGLIGPSGAGKTTIVDVLLRLLRPHSGQVLLDGVEANSIALKDWRGHIGYVAQDMFLMNDTIEKNIRFYNNNISHEDVVKAAKLAHIHDFIEKQSQKFATVVGEKGVFLSGGERQRILLARILARQPEILILDEATSALDNESEAAIQQAIESLHGRITVIAIAHRLTTVKSADRLVVVENGRITEQGQPDELLKDKESYFFKAYNVRN